MIIALIGGKVIDGTGAPARPNSTVVIDGSKIVEVSQQREFGPNVQIIDVSGKTVMPGLIDCHQHFAAWFQWLITEQNHSLMYQAGKTVFALKGCLEAGCTTARDLGGLEAGFRDTVAHGLIPGPRLQTALVIIQPTNGLTDHMAGVGRAISPQGLYATVPGIPTPWCNGPYEARAKVREVLRYGADIVKIANSAVQYRKKNLPARTLFTKEELEAIVDEAHTAGVQVSCHTRSLPGTLAAVRAGVDIIEHGTTLDEQCVEEMAKRGTWYVPTFTIYRWHAAHNPNEAVRKAIQPILKSHVASFALALKAGVCIAMGTDAGYAVGVIGIELQHMVEAGMTPTQAIEVSTRRAAECMQMDDDIGTLEQGKEADLLVVDGDPLQDIHVLSELDRLSLVIQAGRPVAGSMIYPFSSQRPELPRYWIEGYQLKEGGTVR